MDELIAALKDVHEASSRLVGAVLSGDHRQMLIEADAVNKNYPKRSRLISRIESNENL